jgi:hypothetical protein
VLERTPSSRYTIAFALDFNNDEIESREFIIEELPEDCYIIEYELSGSESLIIALNARGLEKRESIVFDGMETDALISVLSSRNGALVIDGSYFDAADMEIETKIIDSY